MIQSPPPPSPIVAPDIAATAVLLFGDGQQGWSVGLLDSRNDANETITSENTKETQVREIRFAETALPPDRLMAATRTILASIGLYGFHLEEGTKTLDVHVPKGQYQRNLKPRMAEDGPGELVPAHFAKGSRVQVHKGEQQRSVESHLHWMFKGGRKQWQEHAPTERKKVYYGPVPVLNIAELGYGVQDKEVARQWLQACLDHLGIEGGVVKDSFYGKDRLFVGIPPREFEKKIAPRLGEDGPGEFALGSNVVMIGQAGKKGGRG